MAGVDDRVVQMQFDNAEFERKLSTTLGSLDKLQKSLDFSNSRKGLDDLSEAGNRFDLGGIGTHIEGVSTKFLAMATIGITALTQIASRAISAGAQFVSSFSFKPMMDGFHEMETAIGATQTILANTARYGTKLPEVQDNLKALNDYADKTIYNFGEMTKNVGLFTNSGIKIGDATSMIKGFSNAAAASGTTAEGAAGAAYQLSQALSTGTVRLMDWKSLTNVGMGNKNMQDSLIEIADKMGTVSKAGTSAKDIQGNFNASLEKGWLSADVMSTYLKIMGGDMDDAKIKSMGFTDAQVKGFRDQQKMAEDAATKVRTATQLVGTVKEAIGSGWSETFTLLLGNFDEATDLFTRINNGIGKLVSGSSDARNKLLQGWKDLGGRTLLITAFSDAIKAVVTVAKMIKDEFRTFFPAKTSADLMQMTRSFADLAGALMPTPATLHKLSLIFDGLFSVVDIGWHIIKELAYAVFNLIGDLRGAGGGALDMAAKVGDLLRRLDEWLIVGGNLHAFFLKIDHVVDVTIGFLKRLFSGVTDLHISFKDFSAATSDVGDGIDRVHGRFAALETILAHLKGIFSGVVKILGEAWDYVSAWFRDLGSKIAASMKPGDFDAAVDLVNVGLIGGLILMFKKFINIEDNFDLTHGFFGKANDALDAFTGKMKAVQTELKAKALMEIAIAIGILTASVLVLSMIDSAALTSAMTALAVGFAQLVASMKLLDSIASNTTGAGKLAILATAMQIMATAAVTLSIAVRILAGLSWGELARGMSGVTAMMALMVASLKALEGDTAGVLAAGVAMVAIATAMSIMAGAVALFGTMDWATIGKGLGAITGLMLILTVTMEGLPTANILAAGLAMIPLATGITILAGAVAIFGNMDLVTMVKGLIGMAAALGIIAGIMNVMPLTLPITAAGLILVGIAIGIMAEGVKMMGSMDLTTMLKGLAGLAALLIILAVGVSAMDGALTGAAALIIVAGALSILTKVLKTLGDMSIGDLIKALVAMAAVFVVLGLAGLVLEPVIPALLGLGIAMALVGAGFALFGAGAWMVGQALKVMAEVGQAAMKVMIAGLNMLLAALPMFIATLLGALLKSAGDILNAAQLMLGILTVLLIQILDTVIKIAPKIAEALVAIITAALVLIRQKFPDVALTAYELLITMLKTIRDHMGEVLQVAIDIVINFAQTLRNNVNRLIDAALNLLFSFIGAIGARANDITGAGVWLLLTFLAGMINNVFRIIDFAVSVIIAFAQTIGNEVGRIIRAGADILIRFVEGVAGETWRVANKGVDIILAFLWAIGNEGVRLARGAADALTNFLNGLADAIRDKAPEIRQAGINIAGAIIDGMTGGLAAKAGDVANTAKDVAKGAVDGVKGFLHIGSPSKVFHQIGAFMAMGLARGLDSDTTAENSAVAQAERIVQAFSETLSKIPDSLDGLDASPVITPVLDLSRVKSAARGLDQLMGAPVITPDVSYDQARVISTTAELTQPTTEPSPGGITEVKFEQNIYAPEALSTNDIFKGTRSQIALMKEELDIE